MKKAAIILILFMYSFATFGATVHLHYCMNVLVSTSIWQDNEGNCLGCGMKKDDGNNCCKDEQKQIKLTVEHKKAFDIVQLNAQAEKLLSSTTEFLSTSYEIIVLNCPTDYKPPPPLSTSLHILNCIYRI